MMQFIPFLLVIICTLGNLNIDATPSTIEQIIEQAIRTFTAPQNRIQFQGNLDNLSQRVNRLTLSDVTAVSAGKNSEEDRYHPVSYVEVYQDAHLTMGMFIMKPNSIIPLHNHPLMQGILKVLQGSVHVQSYSYYAGGRIKQKNESEVCLPNEQYFLDEEEITYSCTDECTATDDDDSFVVRRNSPIIVNNTSDCCVLTPMLRNIHEIRAHNGPATFFDILAPPYHSMAERMGPRECTYFEEVLGVTREDALDTILSSKTGNADERQFENATLRVFYGQPNYWAKRSRS